MTPAALLQHLHSLAPWLDPETTVDRIVIGDPEAEIGRVLVTWMSTFDACRAAVARNCQLIVTHEPTFWSHQDEIATSAGVAHPVWQAAFARKRQFIADHRLVILRCHDVWDFMPEIGIPFAWARFLGLGDTPVAMSGNRALHRYHLEPLTVDDLARRVAAKTAALGEPAVQVVGDGARLVSKIGVGTGCYCNPVEMQHLGCDLSIVCDDGNWYWENLQCSSDNDHPVIRVNHGTSEEPGMRSLSDYLSRVFPHLAVEFLPHGSCFRLVGA